MIQDIDRHLRTNSRVRMGRS